MGRMSDLFGNQDPVAITKRFLKGLKVRVGSSFAVGLFCRPLWDIS